MEEVGREPEKEFKNVEDKSVEEEGRRGQFLKGKTPGKQSEKIDFEF